MAKYKEQPIIQKDKLKYFVYTRISKDDGSYDKSIDQQKDYCTTKADQLWIPRENLIYFTEEESWYKNWTRVEFNTMITKLIDDSRNETNKRNYWWILFYKIDRLSRNNWDFQNIEHILNSGYKLISMTESIDNTPTWKLLFRVLCSFAIFESEKLSSRMILSQVHSLINNNFKSQWWVLPFGYYFADKDENIKTNWGYKDIITDCYMKYKQCQDVAEMWRFIKNKYKDVLINYISSKGIKFNYDQTDITTSERALFTRILDNYKNWVVKYHWYYVKSFNVKDESISNLIRWLMSTTDVNENLNIDGDAEVTWRITLSSYNESLEIVNSILYNEVVAIRKKETWNQTPITNRWIFDWLMFHESWAMIIKMYPDQKWDYIYYRFRSSTWPDRSYSEKKLLTLLMKSEQFNRLFDEWKLQSFKETYVARFKYIATQNIKKKHRQLQMLINKYQSLIQWYQDAIDSYGETESDEIYDATKNIQEYVWIQSELQSELNESRVEYINEFNTFSNIFIKDFYSDKDNCKRAMEVIIDKIIIWENQNIKITFKEWIRKEFNLSSTEIIGSYEK